MEPRRESVCYMQVDSRTNHRARSGRVRELHSRKRLRVSRMNSRTPDSLLETHGAKSASTFPVSILYLGLARAVGMTLLLNQPVKRS